ncbi:MAG: gamma-glutamylcyclotransferase [Scytonematopsis contorta HA4267-MV1]|jgi:cation transport protein ChaC|nr:gamma-glutamylcyclotransferase [Scytonematopsis contorta HA4267-MV1]
MVDIPKNSLHILTEEELQASIFETLKQHQPNTEIWIFAYGSLIWNPIFKYVERRIGEIKGWQRKFCLLAPVGRGTRENPGLFLGLESGGSCQGIAYRIEKANMLDELSVIWRREMIVNTYIPRWVNVINNQEEFNAITFVINHNHRMYAGDLSDDAIVNKIATAKGELGSCADYLKQTVEGLTAAGLVDEELFELYNQVKIIK